MLPSNNPAENPNYAFDTEAVVEGVMQGPKRKTVQLSKPRIIPVDLLTNECSRLCPQEALYHEGRPIGGLELFFDNLLKSNELSLDEIALAAIDAINLKDEENYQEIKKVARSHTYLLTEDYTAESIQNDFEQMKLIVVAVVQDLYLGTERENKIITSVLNQSLTINNNAPTHHLIGFNSNSLNLFELYYSAIKISEITNIPFDLNLVRSWFKVMMAHELGHSIDYYNIHKNPKTCPSMQLDQSKFPIIYLKKPDTDVNPERFASYFQRESGRKCGISDTITACYSKSVFAEMVKRWRILSPNAISRLMEPIAKYEHNNQEHVFRRAKELKSMMMKWNQSYTLAQVFSASKEEIIESLINF
jgi:hypothetical protein